MQTLPVDLSNSTSNRIIFQCLQWRSLFQPWRGSCRMLLGNHRHGGDSIFEAMLMRLRVGSQTLDDVARINATWAAFSDEQRLRMPQLRALRVSASLHNLERLAELPGDAVSFFAVDVVTAVTTEDKLLAKERLEQHADAKVTFKVNAPVVALRRVAPTVPTGTVGRVVGLTQRDGIDCVFRGVTVRVQSATWDVFNSRGLLIGKRTEVPLLLAWALTIHRAQGSEMECVCIDFSRDGWACEGLVYTAVSRVRFLRSLCVRGLTMAHIKTSPACLAFWTALVEESTGAAK